MSNESRAPNALLWIILLAVLIEPLALALILSREDQAAAPQQPDRALAEAVAELTLQMKIERSAPSVPTEATKLPGPEPRSVAPAAPAASRPFPRPKPGVPAVPDAARRYPRRQANVDAWVNHELERKARNEDDVPTLFFHRTTAEILAEFGIPDEANESSAGVRWQYTGTDGRGQMLIDFHRGRVYRFWFSN